ncbi:MAG: UDP-glucose dehydrogenase family protein [Actinomycetota bacterium]
MQVGIVGIGHVGLVTAAALAHMGHDVRGTDVDQEKLFKLSRGETPFFEPGLAELVEKGLRSGKLAFPVGPAEVVAGTEVVLLCVGTPPNAQGDANLVAVEHAATEVARNADGPLVVVEKSTVPAGTADRLAKALARERPDVEFEVVSNPEFLRQGSAVQDALEPDRILVGAGSERGFEVMRRLYEPLTSKGHRLIETDVGTAELAKHACNAFLALKISYANALARLGERAGADVTQVAEVMGSDTRIGPAFLGAGIGFGGYCFPKDLTAFDDMASRLGYDFPFLREILRINSEAVEAAADKVRDELWNVEGKTVAVLGLSYKPNTDDVRLSPALALARRLLELGASVVGYDPAAQGSAKAEVPGLEVAADPYRAAEGAHALVIATEWDEFKELDLPRLRDAMAYPVLVDGRNLLDPQAVRDAGFTYYAMGRPAIASGDRKR